MIEILIYAGIGRVTLFIVGTLLVAWLGKLGQIGLQRWGIVQRDLPFKRVLSCVLVLYALLLPYLVYDIIHRTTVDQISQQIESASTHFADAAMPEGVDDFVDTLESVRTKLETRWRLARLAGTGLLASVLALWTWERRRSKLWLRALLWVLGVSMIALPIILGLELYALEWANWNAVQTFDHGSNTWVYQAIDVDRSLAGWSFYLLPMTAPLALWIVPRLASRDITR